MKRLRECSVKDEENQQEKAEKKKKKKKKKSVGMLGNITEEATSTHSHKHA